MSFKKLALHCAVLALFSFAGGFAGQVFMGSKAEAQSGGDARPMRMSPSFLALNDGKNGKGVNLYVNDGQGGQAFYDELGRMRLQLGTYPGAGERGMPMLGLSDSKGELRLLMRTAGSNESPVIIMKDHNGSDRIVMGLALSDAGEEPFLSIVDQYGARHNIFGSYGGETR